MCDSESPSFIKRQILKLHGRVKYFNSSKCSNRKFAQLFIVEIKEGLKPYVRSDSNTLTLHAIKDHMIGPDDALLLEVRIRNAAEPIGMVAKSGHFTFFQNIKSDHVFLKI